MDIFKAYDVRGIYPQELDEKIAAKIARAYCKLFPTKKNIVVGSDFRTSSPSLKKAIISSLVSCGKTVIDIGKIPVPVFYFAIKHYKHDGGLYVTASHNPKEWNGIKIQKEDAKPVYWENGMQEIQAMVEGDGFIPPVAGKKGKIIRKDSVGDYIRFVCSKIRKNIRKKLKIIIDSGNGACGKLPEKIFKKLGCSATTIYGEPDGNFPNHIADPHEVDTLEKLRREVTAQKADIGIAFDGDGDRIGLVDSEGNVVSEDKLLMMLSRQALESRKGPVVFDVRSSEALIEDAKKHGGTPIMSKVGHAYLLDEIFKRKAIFGGEITMHLYFPYCYYEYDDAIFSSMKISEFVSGIDNLPVYLKSLPAYNSSPEISIEVSPEQKDVVMERLKAFFSSYNPELMDGIRVSMPNAWGIIRPSNTTNHIKLRMEGKTPADLKKIEKIFEAGIKTAGLEMPRKIHGLFRA